MMSYCTESISEKLSTFHPLSFLSTQDDMKLGRNMRAAPRHIIDSMDALRSANQPRDKVG